MSVLNYLVSGGMASVGGDLSDNDRNIANEIVKNFANRVTEYGKQLQVSASLLSVKQCDFMFVAKDSANFHFVFANGAGQNSLNYRDFSQYGRLDLQTITRQVDIDVGTPIWAFSCMLNIPDVELSNHIKKIVSEYINSVLQLQKMQDKTVTNEVISNPETATGLEKFRADYPIGKNKTAFIIMQFGSTSQHNSLMVQIRETLSQYHITALRADDKEYMDDLFSNIKVYMHACDFGIAIYERIIDDNFNPNVSLEVGYIMGMGKEVLLLKDSNLKYLNTDLSGKLYKEFNILKIKETLPSQIEKWITDKGFIK